MALPLIISIDDQVIFKDEIGYEVAGKGVDYLYFDRLDTFYEDARVEDINRTALILVDNCFVTHTAIEADFVSSIKEKFPDFKGKIVLLSYLDFFTKNKAALKEFDGIMNKRDLSWENISKYLQ